MVLRLPQDPRWLQIAFLGSLLLGGVAFLDLQVPPWQPPLLLATAWATQAACTRLLKAPPSGYLSPTITGLGLSILLRSDRPAVMVLAAAAAIASKFLVRVRNKHVFNPANLGLGVAMLASSHAWCSPSQWGEGAVALAWFAALGCAVAHRSFRTDVSLAFLTSWIALRAARVLYLGQRLPVLAHQLSVGSLVIFCFFMISDPKTTPDARWARIVYAGLVASVGMVIQYGFWRQNALVWALLVCSPLVPLFDFISKARRFAWPERAVSCSAVAVSSASLPS